MAGVGGGAGGGGGGGMGLNDFMVLHCTVFHIYL